MAKTSGMQAYAERYAEVKAQAAQMLVCQYMQDTLQLALHQTEGWAMIALCGCAKRGSTSGTSTDRLSIPATRQRMLCRSTWTE